MLTVTRCRGRRLLALALTVSAAGCGIHATGSAGQPTTNPSSAGVVELAPVAWPAAVDEPGRWVPPGSAVTSIPTTTVDQPLRSFTMAFTGDNLTHSPIVRQAARNAGGVGYDFRPMYERVRPLISGVDFAVCHLETPIAPPGEALSTAPRYGVPAELVDALAYAGYDRCSTASNHSLDRGTAGIDTTVGELERVGISQAGMARSPVEATVPLVVVNGVPVAHLSYTFSYNGLQPPEGEEWRSNLIDADRIVRDAIDARRRGAQVVVVSLHDGNEGRAEPTSRQRAVVEAITAWGAVDLVIGHHAHVLQPIEEVNGRWVVFGLGNFLSNMPTGATWPLASQDGAIVTVQVSERPDGTFEIGRPVVHPTWVHRDLGGWVIRLVQPDLVDPTVPTSTRTQLAASLTRTRAVLGPFLAG